MATERVLVMHCCRELFELYPESTSLQPAVEVIERTVWEEPGIAFTHCRGLLETACKTILADRGLEIPANPEPKWLMTQTTRALQLTAGASDDEQAEEGVRQLLSGLNSLISGIVELRKSEGIGPHGRDAMRRVLSSEYALAAAHAVDTAIGLLIRVHWSQLTHDPAKHLRFEKNQDFNEHLEALYPSILVEEVRISASQALYSQDRRAYQQSLAVFRAGDSVEQLDIEPGEAIREADNG